MYSSDDVVGDIVCDNPRGSASTGSNAGNCWGSPGAARRLLIASGMNIARPLALLAALSSTLAPSLAHACWDGVALSTDKLTIQRFDTQSWSPEEVRHWAKWVARVDALLPEGSHLDVFEGDATFCDGEKECVEIGTGLTPFELFERTADAVHASKSTIFAARRMEPVPYTVQVAASHDLAAAEKLAARINASELGIHGFYEAGGFPSMNAFAHVVESFAADDVQYHVVVGAFLAKDEAETARDVMTSELGVHGFVRKLEQSSITEEGC